MTLIIYRIHIKVDNETLQYNIFKTPNHAWGGWTAVVAYIFRSNAIFGKWLYIVRMWGVLKLLSIHKLMELIKKFNGKAVNTQLSASYTLRSYRRRECCPNLPLIKPRARTLFHIKSWGGEQFGQRYCHQKLARGIICFTHLQVYF